MKNTAKVLMVILFNLLISANIVANDELLELEMDTTEAKIAPTLEEIIESLVEEDSHHFWENVGVDSPLHELYEIKESNDEVTDAKVFSNYTFEGDLVESNEHLDSEIIDSMASMNTAQLESDMDRFVDEWVKSPTSTTVGRVDFPEDREPAALDALYEDYLNDEKENNAEIEEVQELMDIWKDQYASHTNDSDNLYK